MKDDEMKNINNIPEDDENKSRVGGVPDDSDTNGIDDVVDKDDNGLRPVDGVENLTVEKVMEDSFLRYSMSVIIDRALPKGWIEAGA